MPLQTGLTLKAPYWMKQNATSKNLWTTLSVPPDSTSRTEAAQSEDTEPNPLVAQNPVLNLLPDHVHHPGKDTGLVTPAADPVLHLCLGLVPDPAPGHFPHPVGVDFPIQAHALDLGVTAALDPGPALLILMDICVGKLIEALIRGQITTFHKTAMRIQRYAKRKPLRSGELFMLDEFGEA